MIVCIIWYTRTVVSKQKQLCSDRDSSKGDSIQGTMNPVESAQVIQYVGSNQYSWHLRQSDVMYRLDHVLPANNELMEDNNWQITLRNPIKMVE